MPRSWKSTAIPLLPLLAVRPLQSLSACTRVHFFLQETKFHTRTKQAQLKLDVVLESLRQVSTSCLAELYVSNSCSSPLCTVTTVSGNRVSCSPISGYSILFCLPLPPRRRRQLPACAVRSVDLKILPFYTPSLPCRRVLASPSTYIRVKQRGGMPHSTLVLRRDRFVNNPHLVRHLLHQL